MNPSPAVADAAPPDAVEVFDVRTLSDEDAHRFGVAVASMSRKYDALKAENAALRGRVGELERRVANQNAIIKARQRTDRTAQRDPAALSMIERIDRETAAVGASEPSLQVPPDVAVHVVGSDCCAPPREPKPARRETASPCTDPGCGLCAAPAPSPQPPPGARRGGAFRLRWPR